ncbi:MAG: PilZ domain-containing protein [Bdellovibrio sp.]|jgi:hypothetical protein
MSKAAFEKVRSNLEKKKILAQADLEHAEVTLKIGEDHLVAFIPTLEGDFFSGHLPAGTIPEGKHEVLASFVLAPHRYFYNGQAEVRGSRVIVDVAGDLFQFQRRASMRVEVPVFLKLEMNLTEIDGKKVFVLAQAHDISAGGVRFFYTDYRGPVLTSGMLVKGVLHSGPQKLINIEGTIRHIQDVKTDTGTQTHYGIEFLKSPNQRMTLLSLEVQRRAIAGSS